MTPPGLFVTGTDTDVGKTYVTALIARELCTGGVRVGVYKPACSGSSVDSAGRAVWPDLEELSAAVEHRFDLDRICPQRFHAPLAPPVAARKEGERVDARLLRTAARWWEDRVDLLLVEGVGGLLCPLTEDETIADLAADLGFPLLIVSRLGLGTINHTLLTLEVARSRGLPIAGIVLNETVPQANDPACETNFSELAARCDVPILAVVAHHQDGGLRRPEGGAKIDWFRLAGQSESSESSAELGARNAKREETG